jgi:hypothetical protein
MTDAEIVQAFVDGARPVSLVWEYLGYTCWEGTPEEHEAAWEHVNAVLRQALRDLLAYKAKHKRAGRKPTHPDRATANRLAQRNWYARQREQKAQAG